MQDEPAQAGHVSTSYAAAAQRMWSVLQSEHAWAVDSSETSQLLNQVGPTTRLLHALQHAQSCCDMSCMSSELAEQSTATTTEPSPALGQLQMQLLRAADTKHYITYDSSGVASTALNHIPVQPKSFNCSNYNAPEHAKAAVSLWWYHCHQQGRQPALSVSPLLHLRDPVHVDIGVLVALS